MRSRGHGRHTPVKYTKQIASRFGGTRQGVATRGRTVSRTSAGVRTQFTHHSTRSKRFSKRQLSRRPQMVDGKSAEDHRRCEHGLYLREGQCQMRPRSARPNYFEMIANRGIYNDGWYANTTRAARAGDIKHPAADRRITNGNCYNITEAYSKRRSCSEKCPAMLKEMQKTVCTGGRQSSLCFR